MAVSPFLYGVGFVRQQIYKFVRGERDRQSAWSYMKDKYPMSIGRNTFYRNFREIQSEFDFKPRLAQLNPLDPVRRSLINPISRLMPAKYEYKVLYQIRDRVGGEVLDKYATHFSDKLLSLEGVLAGIKRIQEALGAGLFGDTPKLGEDNRPPDLLDVALVSVKQGKSIL